MSEHKPAVWPSERELGQALGYRLRTVREERRLSQTELARQLGLSKSSITKYEAGVHLPAVPVLVRLALGLRVSADYLMGLVAAAAAPPAGDSELGRQLRDLAELDEGCRPYVVPVLAAIVKGCRLAAEARRG